MVATKRNPLAGFQVQSLDADGRGHIAVLFFHVWLAVGGLRRPLSRMRLFTGKLVEYLSFLYKVIQRRQMQERPTVSCIGV